MVSQTEDVDVERGRPTVLVVEDDPELREIYRLWLQREYDVETATDGDVDIEPLDHAVDIVLTDREMPGVDGDSLLSRLRSTDTSVPVVSISGSDDASKTAYSFDDRLRKPIRQSNLLDTIEAQVSRTPLVAED